MADVMVHGWLSVDEQRIMDTATSTAELYPYVALIAVPRNWKAHLTGILGTAVDTANVIHARSLTKARCSEYGLTGSALVRLDPGQATLAKLRSDGVHADPTGELWGNMLVDKDKMDRNTHDHLSNPESNAKSLVEFASSGRYGTTLAGMADFEKKHPAFFAKAKA